MKRLLPIFLLLSLLLVRPAPAAPAPGEYVLLVGGPSLMVWEKYKKEPHDHWWANFIRAARIRTEQILFFLRRAIHITLAINEPGNLRIRILRANLFGPNAPRPDEIGPPMVVRLLFVFFPDHQRRATDKQDVFARGGSGRRLPNEKQAQEK